jgi:hypothetical protein
MGEFLKPFYGKPKFGLLQSGAQLLAGWGGIQDKGSSWWSLKALGKLSSPTLVQSFFFGLPANTRNI